MDERKRSLKARRSADIHIQTQASSEVWEGYLAYYGVLSSMAQRMPDVAAELQTVVDFMATGPRKKTP